MPAVGDQHRANGATTANPFEEHERHISEYTAQEIATLQSRLNKRLGPEYISTRPGPGNQKVAYLSAEKAINLANEVFGFNGWSTSIQNIQIDFVDENTQSGKVSLGLSVVVRVTLRDGTYHEDIGYGGIENCKGKAMAFEKSKKEATTDALKRALRSFGNVLGNCIYDKDYITKVSKVKAGNGRFDVNDLHRHPDFAPKVEQDAKAAVDPPVVAGKPPSLEFEDSFDVSEFDDIDFTESDLIHPEEVLLPVDTSLNNSIPNTRTNMSNINTPSRPPQSRPTVPQTTTYSRLPGQQPIGANGVTPGASTRPGIPTSRPPSIIGADNEQNDESGLSSPGLPSQHFGPQAGAPMPPPTAGFYSARAAKDIDPNKLVGIPPKDIKFNPHAESPSIRKTVGVDHNKSVPVRRELLKPETSAPPNLVEPRVDMPRRMGMPGQPTSGSVGRPGMSTSAYRPPTRSGAGSFNNGSGANNGSDRVLTAAKRPPLGDVSNMQHNATAAISDGAEAKRQRISTGGPGTNVTSAISPGA